MQFNMARTKITPTTEHLEQDLSTLQLTSEDYRRHNEKVLILLFVTPHAARTMLYGIIIISEIKWHIKITSMHSETANLRQCWPYHALEINTVSRKAPFSSVSGAIWWLHVRIHALTRNVPNSQCSRKKENNLWIWFRSQPKYNHCVVASYGPPHSNISRYLYLYIYIPNFLSNLLTNQQTDRQTNRDENISALANATKLNEHFLLVKIGKILEGMVWYSRV